MQLTVSSLYRPADTHLGKEAEYLKDWNMLYWTKELQIVQSPLQKSFTNASLSAARLLMNQSKSLSAKGPQSDDQEFEALPSETERISSNSKGKGKGGKGAAS